MPKKLALPNGGHVEITNEAQGNVKTEVAEYLTNGLNNVLKKLEEIDSSSLIASYGYAHRGLEIARQFTCKTPMSSESKVLTQINHGFLLDATTATPMLTGFIQTNFTEPFLKFWQTIHNCCKEDKSDLMADDEFFGTISKYARQGYIGDTSDLNSALACYVAKRVIKSLPGILMAKEVALDEKRRTEFSLEHQANIIRRLTSSAAVNTHPAATVSDPEIPPAETENDIPSTSPESPSIAAGHGTAPLARKIH